MPHAELLEDSGITLSDRGYIEIDGRSEASVLGVFAASHVTIIAIQAKFECLIMQEPMPSS